MQQEVAVVNELGLHARAAAVFVSEANRFRSRIEIVRGADRVDGKSILGILTLIAPKGTMLTLVTDGPDESEAIEALVALVADKFGEGR